MSSLAIAAIAGASLGGGTLSYFLYQLAARRDPVRPPPRRDAEPQVAGQSQPEPVQALRDLRADMAEIARAQVALIRRLDGQPKADTDIGGLLDGRLKAAEDRQFAALEGHFRLLLDRMAALAAPQHGLDERLDRLETGLADLADRPVADHGAALADLRGTVARIEARQRKSEDGPAAREDVGPVLEGLRAELRQLRAAVAGLLGTQQTLAEGLARRSGHQPPAESRPQTWRPTNPVQADPPPAIRPDMPPKPASAAGPSGPAVSGQGRPAEDMSLQRSALSAMLARQRAAGGD